MRSRNAVTLLTLALLAGCGGDEQSDGGATPAREVVVALDFTPNAVHAGLYAAAGGRRDADAGLDLKLRAPSGSTDSLKLLGSGRADFAVVDIHDLGLARERGQDLVGVAALVQRPLAAVIAGRGVRRPRDLEGRRVGVTGLPSDDAVLRAVVEGDGGDFERVRRVTIGFSAVGSLVSRKVAAVTAFWNAEGVALRERGVATREFRVDDFGAPAYPELVLACRRGTLVARPDLVDALKRLLAAGTEEALRDSRPALATIARASGADGALVRRQFAAVAPALRPAGRLRRSALEGWARFAHRFGILEGRPDVDAAFAPG